MENLIGLFLISPELGIRKVEEYIDTYKPLVYSVFEKAVEMYKDYANDEEFFNIRATVKKNMFSAYVNAGFTEEQAMALLLNDNLQLMKNLQNVSKINTINNSKKTV